MGLELYRNGSSWTGWIRGEMAQIQVLNKGIVKSPARARVCVCVYIYIYIYIYICVCVRARACVCVHACMSAGVRTHVYLYRTSAWADTHKHTQGRNCNNIAISTLRTSLSKKGQTKTDAVEATITSIEPPATGTCRPTEYWPTVLAVFSYSSNITFNEVTTTASSFHRADFQRSH